MRYTPYFPKIVTGVPMHVNIGTKHLQNNIKFHFPNVDYAASIIKNIDEH